MDTVNVLWCVFEEMLNQRRAEFCPDGIPDCVWKHYMDILNGNEGCNKVCNNDPIVIVDNIFVNGAWGFYDEYKSALETDAEFELRATADGGECYPEERIVIYNSPVMENIIYGR